MSVCLITKGIIVKSRLVLVPDFRAIGGDTTIELDEIETTLEIDEIEAVLDLCQ